MIRSPLGKKGCRCFFETVHRKSVEVALILRPFLSLYSGHLQLFVHSKSAQCLVWPQGLPHSFRK